MTPRNRATLVISLALCVVAAASGPATAQATDITPATGDTTGLDQLSPEDLFLRASSSALQFQHLLEPARRVLVRDHEKTLPYMLTLLDTDDPRERLALEDVIVRIGEPALPSLIAAFDSELSRHGNSRGARLGATLLGRIGGDDAAQALARGLTHPDWKVRSSVASALGRIAQRDSVQPLRDLLEDPNEIVRKSAADALSRIASNGEAALDPATIEALARALGDDYYSVRYPASRALGACGERALDVLERVLEQGDERAALLAADALGIIGSGRARSDLRALTASQSWPMRARAAYALSDAGPSGRDRSRLEELLRDPNPLVVAAASSALRGQ